MNGYYSLVAGRGDEGYHDGSFTEAQFHWPDGLAVRGWLHCRARLAQTVRWVSPLGGADGKRTAGALDSWSSRAGSEGL